MVANLLYRKAERLTGHSLSFKFNEFHQQNRTMCVLHQYIDQLSNLSKNKILLNSVLNFFPLYWQPSIRYSH